MARKSPPLDSAVEHLRLYGGTPAAIAALVSNPDLAAWLRDQALKETANDKHIRARADSQLMKIALGESRPGVLIAVIEALHYDGRFTPYVARIVHGNLPDSIIKPAEARERWICESPTRKAAHLAKLQAVLAPMSNLFDVERADDGG